MWFFSSLSQTGWGNNLQKKKTGTLASMSRSNNCMNDIQPSKVATVLLFRRTSRRSRLISLILCRSNIIATLLASSFCPGNPLVDPSFIPALHAASSPYPRGTAAGARRVSVKTTFRVIGGGWGWDGWGMMIVPERISFLRAGTIRMTAFTFHQAWRGHNV